MTVSPPAATEPRNPQTSRDLSFSFTGNGWEYFKIWIVNVLLTILTLGIYSAWAKVRTQQYFYGNTVLDDASFRYTAKPLTILKGRLIALAAFVLFSLAQKFVPQLALLMIVAFLVLMPAIIVRAMAFRLGNSKHRNVAFSFRRNYKQAYAVFMAPTLALVALMIVFSFGARMMGDGQDGAVGAGIGIAMLAYLFGLPFFNYLASKFYVDNSRYGDGDFVYNGGAGGFYKLYAMTILLALGIVLLVTAMLGFLGSESMTLFNAARESSGEGNTDQMLVMMMSQSLLLLATVPAYLLVYAYFQAQRFNLVYGNSVLADHYGFRAKLSTAGLAWLYLSNLVIVVITLGLGIAWAKVRAARYHLERLEFVAGQDLGLFAAAQQEKTGALGDEMGEVFDLEVGI